MPLDRPPLPLLITGIAGVAGYNALHYFQSKYPGQVIGIRQYDNWRMVGPGIVACNAEDYQGLSRLFDQHHFRAVLDCAGNCALKSCELDPEMAWRINVEGIRNLLAVTAGRDVRLVHLSIDLVFGGWGAGNLTEAAPTDPVTVYGKSMVAAEELLFANRPDACTLRISLPMGVSFNGHAGAIDWIQSRFKKGKPATLYFDEIRTPSYTDCLNALCEVVLAPRNLTLRVELPDSESEATAHLQGLYHAGGPRRLSLYQIAQIINRVGGYDPKLLIGCPRHLAGPIPPRAGNVAMNSEKLTAALGFAPLDPWPFDEQFVPTHRQWHYDRPPGEGGSTELLSDVLYRNPARRLAAG